MALSELSVDAASDLTVAIRPQGQLANQMFELMLANEICARVTRSSTIIEYDYLAIGHGPPRYPYCLGDWGLELPRNSRKPQNPIVISGNRANLRRLAKKLDADTFDHVTVSGAFLDIGLYREPIHYRSLFPVGVSDQNSGYGRDKLCIHVRAGDALDGAHKDYFPLPIDYYKTLLQQTSLQPVFVGQLAPNRYTRALKSSFPSAEFASSNSRISDFNLLRNSHNIALSISTFSWLAAWLSTKAERIFFPVAGMLNPEQRPDIDLIPRRDPRYEFFKFETFQYSSASGGLDTILANGLPFRRCSARDIPRFRSKIEMVIFNRLGVRLPSLLIRK